MKSSANGVTVYRMTSEDVERLLATQYGRKLAAVNQASLSRQNAKREKWLKSLEK